MVGEQAELGADGTGRDDPVARLPALQRPSLQASSQYAI